MLYDWWANCLSFLIPHYFIGVSAFRFKVDDQIHLYLPLKLLSFAMWCRVVWQIGTNVSEQRAASVFRRMTSAVTYCNSAVLWRLWPNLEGLARNERLGCFCPHAASTLTLAGGSVMPCYCATHLGDGDHALVRATCCQSHPTRRNIPFFNDAMYVIYSTYKCRFKFKEVRESMFAYYSYLL